MASSAYRSVNFLSDNHNREIMYKSSKHPYSSCNLMDTTTHSLVSHYDPHYCTTESALINERKKCFYILLSLFFLGILLLILIVLVSVIGYASCKYTVLSEFYMQRKRERKRESNIFFVCAFLHVKVYKKLS